MRGSVCALQYWKSFHEGCARLGCRLFSQPVQCVENGDGHPVCWFDKQQSNSFPDRCMVSSAEEEG